MKIMLVRILHCDIEVGQLDIDSLSQSFYFLTFDDEGSDGKKPNILSSVTHVRSRAHKPHVDAAGEASK